VIHSDLPQVIVNGVLAPMGVVAAEAMPPGMSGARIFQCRLASGDLWALKRWPAGTTQTRVDEVHTVIHQSRSNRFVLVPTLHEIANSRRTCFTHEHQHWDMMQWMPGTAATADAGLDQIRAGAEAIALFHASVRGLGVRHQVAPAVTSRLRRMDELAPHIRTALERSGKPQLAPELGESIQAASRLIRWKWDEAQGKIARSLRQYANRNVHTQYVLRDVHREHILFAGGQPTGMIDFDAVRVDSPATDLARWVGSFLGGHKDSESVWDAALAGFYAGNALNYRTEMEFDPNMAKDLCFATIWISVANWLVWLLCERRTFPPGPKQVAARIRELLGSAPL
jgi:Ser/Thr protein kinase RdoA (MazF antagonist)